MKTYNLLILLLTMVPLVATASGTEAPASTAAAPVSAAVSPVIVTAADLVTKVYGAIDLPESIDQAMAHTDKALNLTPSADEDGLWLDSGSGYSISYSGMTPEVTAVAQFSGDSLSGFSYFFTFPYDSDSREEVNRNQCEFCSSLLQEMYDMGSIMGVPADGEPMAGAPLFEALGSYEGHHINISLHDNADGACNGHYLLVLQVTPNSYNLNDDILALGN